MFSVCEGSRNLGDLPASAGQTSTETAESSRKEKVDRENHLIGRFTIALEPLIGEASRPTVRLGWLPRRLAKQAIGRR